MVLTAIPARPGLTAKIWKIMRLMAIFLFAVCIGAAARTTGQTVTFSGKNVSLTKLFSVIKEQTGYVFFYDQSLLQNAKPITLEVKDAPLENVLQQTFSQQPFSFTIVNKTITIVPKTLSAVEGPVTDIERSRSVDVKGRLVNENNEPVPGASVKVKGTTLGTTTNANGEFTLPAVPENATLIFSGTNIETFEHKLSPLKGGAEGGGFLDLGTITARIKISALNEVIINKGYYTEKQKYSVSNVGRVTAKEIERQPVSNPLLALQGRVPGLVVTQSTGLPGSGVSVRIQGQNTIGFNVGNDPLYVVDGVPYPSRLISALSSIQGGSGSNEPSPVIGVATNSAGNPLGFINPSDIESIDVLKDADATAIFGSRAANGAILITTKKGKAGKTKIAVNVQHGFGKVPKYIKLMNTEQYLEMRREALINDGITVSPLDANYDLNGTWDQNRYTDWQKVLIGGTAQYTNISTSISGGTANTRFLISPGYHKETTVFPGNLSSTSASLHFNITNNSNNQKFGVQLTGSYLSNNSQLINNDLTTDAIRLAPNAPKLFNDDGSLNWEPLPNGNATWTNPLAYLNQKYSNKTSSLVSNAILTYKIISGLELKSSFGYTNLQSDQFALFPHSAVIPQDRASTERRSTFNLSSISSWIVEPQINYTKEIKKGKIDVLFGASIQQNSNVSNGMSGTGYDNDLVIKNIVAAPTKSVGKGISEYRYSGLFGRINYNWLDRYVLNINVRRDGSSRFGVENRFHNFGSIGGAWIFSNEGFIQKQFSWISFGKLRASYGTTGNDQIGNYGYLDLYAPVTSSLPYQGAIGNGPQNLPNPYLQWEETKKMQFGLDIGLFNDRFSLNSTFSRNRSSNQLLSYTLPIITGFPSISSNFPALVENTNWEFTLQAKIFKKSKFNWTANVNLTIPRNELVEFPNLSSSSYSSSLVVGQPVTISRLFNFNGVDPSTGLYQFINKSGNIVSSASFDDRTILTSFQPKYYGGIENTIEFGSLELSFLFQFSNRLGTDYRMGNAPGVFVGTSNIGNQPIYLLDRWRKPGDISGVQKMSTTFSNRLIQMNAVLSNAAVFDASFARLRNVSLSGQLPLGVIQKLKLESANLYVNAQNLLTIGRYRGLDIESGNASLPALRVITMGIKLSL